MSFRWRLPLLVVGLGVTFSVSATLEAAEPTVLDETGQDEIVLLRVRADYVSARARLDRYVRFEHPRAVDHLDAEIKLAIGEVELLRRRAYAYRNISTRDPNDATSPVFMTKQRLKLALMAARFDLENLKQKRCELIQTYRDQRRVLRLDFEIARRQLTARLPQPEEIAPPPKQ